MAIVFSLLYNVPILLHVTSVFSRHFSPEHIPFLLVQFTFSHHCVDSTPVFVAARAGLCAFLLLRPTPGISLLSGRSKVPYAKTQYGRFRAVHCAVLMRFHPALITQAPRTSLAGYVFVLVHLIGAGLSLAYILYFASVLYPPNFCCERYISFLFLVSPPSHRVFRAFVDYAIPPCPSSPFLLRSPVLPYQLLLTTSTFWLVPYFYVAVSAFSRSLFNI